MGQDTVFAILSEVREEISRYEAMLRDPEGVLEFYDAYRGSIVQQVLRFKGCSEEDVFHSVVERLRELPMLAHCVIEYEEGAIHQPQLLIAVSNCGTHLMRLDMHGRRFCDLYGDRMEKQEALVWERQRGLTEVEHRLVEAREVFPYYLLDADNKFPASAHGAFEAHLKDLGYGRRDILRIKRDIPGFYNNCLENVEEHDRLVDRARLALAEEQLALEKLRDRNVILDIVRELRELLLRHKYREEPVLGFGMP